jgi:hypothetical protein
MAVIQSESAPIGFISTPRIATSAPVTTYGYLVSDKGGLPRIQR